MKIAALTFHSAHNFGSALQSYSLQTFIEKISKEENINSEYYILNYRSDIQRDMYRLIPKVNSMKSFIKFLMRIPFYWSYKKKNELFENFIANKLNTTNEINSIEELAKYKNDYDLFLCGSDQIWNVRAQDSTTAYYLDFTDKPKASYSASFGPLKIDWEKYDKDFYTSTLKKISHISVREEGSADNVKLLTGHSPNIHIDPTMLLTKEEWQQFGSGKTFNDGNYILMYCLEPSTEQLRIAKKLSKHLNLPIVITRYNNKYDYFNGFKKCYSTGPEDFISLINNAKFVISSSFHGNVFAILLEKPFFAIDGMNDNRISNLLKLTNLEARSIDTTDLESKLLDFTEIDFTEARISIAKERQKSHKYLLEILKGVVHKSCKN